MKTLTRIFFIAALIFTSLYSCRQQQEVLRVGMNTFPGYAPFHLADHQGFFGKNNVRIVEMPAASGVIRSFRNGTIDAAALTLDEVLRLLDEGIDVKVVLIIDFSKGADVIMAKPHIKNIQALKGKKVGVEASALGAFTLLRALEIHGLQEKDIAISHHEVSEHAASFATGNLDAVVTFEPFRTQILQQGGHEIFSSREIPGEIIDLLVIRSSFLKKNPQTSQKIVEGWFQALSHAQSDKHQALNIYSQHLGISLDEVIQSLNLLHVPGLQENRQLLLDGGSKKLLDSTAKLQNFMHGKELLSTQHPLESLFTAELLPPLD